jgi:hypothetical protein
VSGASVNSFFVLQLIYFFSGSALKRTSAAKPQSWILAQPIDAFAPGLQDGIFSNQNYNLGKFSRVLQWKMLVYVMAQVVYFTAIWYILWKISALYGHLVYFSHFGMLYQEKSGNPDR